VRWRPPPANRSFEQPIQSRPIASRLQPPDRLAAALTDRYRIERELGAGGMATVYLAEDLKHDRRVAIKVLRPELAAVIGAERFLSEIKTTANLQHPHILALHDSGAVDGLLYYVMPFVEGESLRDRLAREKQLPIADALRIAAEVASALDYAHRHSVIHRDIKPENILLHDGRALVADFGIALAASRADSGSRMTETGMSLGTPHYMSPEQAMGERDITARSDVYALGAVTYEMLTGEPPFTGPTAQSIVARVMTETPRHPRIGRPTIPPHVEFAVLTALEKLPADRFPTAAAFAEALERPGAMPPAAKPAVGRRGRRWAMPAAVAAAMVAGAAAGWALRSPGQTAPDSEQFRILRGVTADGGIAVSPDGRTIVASVSQGDSGLGLLVQRLDELDPRPLPGTEGATEPSFAPDGREIVYSTETAIRRQALAGGAPVTVFGGGAGGFLFEWGDDGFFYFTDARGSISRILVAGGTPEQLALPDSSVGGGFYGWMDYLPSGKGVIATLITPSYGANRVVVLDLATREIKDLAQGSMGRYDGRGRLLYASADGTLLAAPFDERALSVTGPATAVARGVWQPGFGRAAYDVAGGTLVYQTAPGLAPGTSGLALVVVHRNGVRRELPFGRGSFNAVAVSPDGRRVAVETVEGLADGGTISTFEFGDSVLTRLTFEGLNSYPAWSADGRRVAFAREVNGERDFWWQPADGTGRAELVLSQPRAQFELDFSRDGRWLAYRDGNGSTTDALALWVAPADGSAEPRRFLDSAEVTARSPAISPDGRWLAYAARPAVGGIEVFVRPFPDPGSGAVWQVSTDGGQEPVWSHSGRELFYHGATHLMAAELGSGPSFSVRARRQLFNRADFLANAFHPRYAVLPGDTSFVMIQSRFGAGDLETVVVTNWDAGIAAADR
jgi:serine/threonine-protein kinase